MEREHIDLEFIPKTMAAACVGHFVQIMSRRVVYFGRKRKKQYGAFPALAGQHDHNVHAMSLQRNRGDWIRTSDLMKPIQEALLPNPLPNIGIAPSLAPVCTSVCCEGKKSVDSPPIETLAATLFALSSQDWTKLAAILSAKSFIPPDGVERRSTLQNQREGLANPNASANPASSSGAEATLGTSDLASCVALLTPKYPDLAP
jgi:hypothetical protein